MVQRTVQRISHEKPRMVLGKGGAMKDTAKGAVNRAVKNSAVKEISSPDALSKEAAIFAKGLVKHYKKGAPQAGLNGFDLEVPAGSICALLGPNGAGKTTAVRVLSTLLRADAGEAYVAGISVRHAPAAVRAKIGVVGQHAAVDELLSAQQNLELFGKLHHLEAKEAKRRAHELLARFDLTAAAQQAVSTYSGGMRRRLDLAASLLVQPAVLFVDEPTTGLDPASRHEVWQAIKEFSSAGTSILLTTQYLEEADVLAQQLAFLHQGKIIAQGTPEALKKQVGGSWLKLTLHREDDLGEAQLIAAKVASGAVIVDAAARLLRVPVASEARDLLELACLLRSAHLEVARLELHRPSLDEVFFHLSGKGVSA